MGDIIAPVRTRFICMLLGMVAVAFIGCAGTTASAGLTSTIGARVQETR